MNIVSLDEYIGLDFDEVNGEPFIRAYIPKESKVKTGSSNKSGNNKALRRFDKIISGTFNFHYDTNPLEKNIHLINPNDNVTMSVKVHGTSVILSHIPVRIPTNIFVRLWRKIKGVEEYNCAYDIVYSSRNIIKNQYINKKRTIGYYKTDIWGDVANKISQYIPKDMSVYGEIVDYLSGSDKFIQKDYDYGCSVGEWKFMPYRINYKGEEWNVQQVKDWTIEICSKLKPEENWLMPIVILWNGTLAEKYPDIDQSTHWHQNALLRIQNDTEMKMEKRETLCKNNVPREGIVLRLNGDLVKQAWKCKTNAFRSREMKMIDNEEIDIEIQNTEYYEDNKNSSKN